MASRQVDKVKFSGCIHNDRTTMEVLSIIKLEDIHSLTYGPKNRLGGQWSVARILDDFFFLPENGYLKNNMGGCSPVSPRRPPPPPPPPHTHMDTMKRQCIVETIRLLTNIWEIVRFDYYFFFFFFFFFNPNLKLSPGVPGWRKVSIVIKICITMQFSVSLEFFLELSQ